MEQLGDYKILREIEQEDFSKVYLGEHTLMKKRYLLKVLSPELTKDPAFVERFQKDVSALAHLEHPSIVKIHNISFANDSYFLIMDPVFDGYEEVMNLDKYLDLQGSVLNESSIESILLSIGSALDYAHSLTKGEINWIHGSLNLSNILIRKKGRDHQVFLSDFGLAHLIGEGRQLISACKNLAESFSIGQEHPQLKRYRSFIRNFFFLAPEQKVCLSDRCSDAKADVFSFGVLAYYLLTRQFPEGIVEPVAKIAPDMKLPWDLLIRCFLDKNPSKRPAYIQKSMEGLLKQEESDGELYAWKAIEKKVEDKMQMSFAFEKSTQVDSSLSYYAFPETSSHLKPVIKPRAIERPTYEPDPGAIFQKELSVSRYAPTKIEIKEVEPILSEMSIIPGGTYFRGSNTGARDEMPRHAVTVDSFAIDVHPITNEQFVRFLMAMGGEKDGNNNDIIRLRDSRVKKTSGKFIIESGYNKHPVVGITWYGAVAYSKWVGKRLPTEAEWEIAASGGKESGTYPTGDNIERNQANFFSSDTTPVMSYPAGFFSLYDMAGNVYEWCDDWYAYNYYDSSVQEPENPKGPLQGVYRVLRGGCWKSLKEDLRYSHRHRNNPGTVNRTYGFRCAADVR